MRSTGDDGPDVGVSRPASLVVGLAVGAGLGVALATGGAPVGVAVTAIAGVALGGVVRCRARGGPAWTAVASALTPVVALGGLAGVGLVVRRRGALASGGAVETAPAVGLAVGAGLAAFGATAGLGDGMGTDVVRRTRRTAAATTTVVGLAAGATLATRFDALGTLPTPAVDPAALLAPVLSPGEPTVSLVSFAALVVGAALAGRAALATLPIAELASRRRREAVAADVDRVDDALATAVRFGVIGGGLCVLTAVPPVRAALPVAAVGGLLASAALRGAVLALGVVAAALALAGRLLRAVAGSTASALGRLLPTTVGGGLVVGGALAGGGVVRRLIEAVPGSIRPVAEGLVAGLGAAGVVLGVALVALALLTGAVTVLAVAAVVDLVPTRGTGGALAGAGLTLCATVVGVGRAPALATFALVGLGIVAWDASDRGVGSRAALGPGSAPRVEAVHAVGSAGVATAGVGVAWAAHRLVAGVAVVDGVLVGTVAAVAGALLLLVALRG
jgi:hypothetical protein